MFQRAAATPLSMRSSVQHHARPFAAQCNNNKQRHQRAPASISMTRRRHHVVSASFSVSDITGPVNDTVNDLKSTEVRNFPQLLYIFFVVLGRENYTIRFRLFAFFDDRSRETRGRPPSSSILPKDHPTHPRARALSSEGEKRGRRRRRRKQRFGGRDSIRFEFFFSFDDGGRGDVSLPIEFVSFFPPKENASSAFLFFSFLSRKGGGEVDFFIIFILVFFTTCSR